MMSQPFLSARWMQRRILLLSVAMLPVLAAACGEVQVAPAGPQAQTDTAGADGSGGGGGSDTAGSECVTDFDCTLVVKGKTPCNLPVCNNGTCGLKNKEAGTSCTDPSLSISECQQATCDGNGSCKAANLTDGTVCGLGACGKKCAAGVCEVATAADYDDNNPCTKDYCNQGIEVRHEPISDLTVNCDDGDACTGTGGCVAGKCQGQPLSCNDGLACTDDTCDKATGCVFKGKDSLCDDSNPCTQDTCDASKGCVAAAANSGADCNDGNSCTQGDTCSDQGVCGGTASCSCKTDADCVQSNLCLGPASCVSGLCQFDAAKAVQCDTAANTACAVAQCVPATGACSIVPLTDGKACDDGNACTSGSVCKAGTCSGPVNVPCNDSNPCTDDSCSPVSGCVFTPNDAACDDGNACTAKDGCVNGGCNGEGKNCDDGKACTLDTCDGASGKCSNTPNNAACNDDNPCTSDACDPTNGCASKPDDTATCDDGDACTNDKCSGGQCSVTFVCACKDDSGCNDNNPCTQDKCTQGACSNTAAPLDGSPCSTADLCQEANTGVCGGGICKSGNKPIACPAPGPCQTATCNPASGKCEPIAKADGVACDADGNGCTENDKCVSGACQAGAAVNCSNSAKVCHVANCKSTSASTFSCEQTAVPAGSACDDGLFCTTGDVCDAAGVCKGPTPQTCAAQTDACNTGTCSEASKSCTQVAKAKGTGCDDGKFCTSGDACDGSGKCAGGVAPGCSGGNCLSGYCDAASDKCATQFAAANTACNDGTACTSGDVCDAGGKCGGSAVKCDDGNPCTTDSCDAVKGCIYTIAVGAACDDGSACTKTDKCDTMGKCGGTWICQCKVDGDCNDGNACTTDKCNAGTCSNTAAATAIACDDSNPCTTASVCNGATCTPEAGKVFDCSSQNDTCNTGTCYTLNGAAACKKAPKAAGTACSDGLFCTSNDTCDGAGKCSGPALVCPPAGTCKTATCSEAAKGCATSSLAKGTACSDGNGCTSGDGCDGAGVCTPGAALPDFAACSDSSLSTSGDFCYANKCAGFVAFDGPSAGPASQIAYQAGEAIWATAANNSTALDETTGGNWALFYGKPTNSSTLGWSQAGPNGPTAVRTVTDQVAAGHGGYVAYRTLGSVSWAASGTSLHTSLKAAIADTVDWYAADSHLSGTSLYVGLAGYAPASAKNWVANCQGPAASTSGWTCTAVVLASGNRPVAIDVSASFNTITKTTSYLSTYASMAVNASNQGTSMSTAVSTFNASSYSVTAGPALAILGTQIHGGVWRNTLSPLLTGSTTSWVVGPYGYAAYTKAGTTGLLPATVVSSGQSNYHFRSVVKLDGHILVWGSKANGTSASDRIPVMLAHAEVGSQQSGANFWTEFELAKPTGASSCFANFLAGGDLATDGSSAIVGLVNVCSAGTLKTVATRRGVYYMRALK